MDVESRHNTLLLANYIGATGVRAQLLWTMICNSHIAFHAYRHVFPFLWHCVLPFPYVWDSSCLKGPNLALDSIFDFRNRPVYHWHLWNAKVLQFDWEEVPIGIKRCNLRKALIAFQYKVHIKHSLSKLLAILYPTILKDFRVLSLPDFFHQNIFWCNCYSPYLKPFLTLN